MVLSEAVFLIRHMVRCHFPRVDVTSAQQGERVRHEQPSLLGYRSPSATMLIPQ
jgi:hypothetical protein